KGGTLVFEVWRKSLDDLHRHLYRLKRRSRYASKHHVAFSHQIGLAFFVHFESQHERLVTEAPDIGRDFNQIIEHQRLAKVEMDLHSREPDVETIKHLRVAK